MRRTGHDRIPFRSGEMQMFAEAIEQRRARIDPQIVLLSVYTQG